MLGASWRAGLATSLSSGEHKAVKPDESNGEGDFDLLVEKEGPKPFVESIALKGTGGARVIVGEDGEQVEEKTLFQK